MSDGNDKPLLDDTLRMRRLCRLVKSGIVPTNRLLLIYNSCKFGICHMLTGNKLKWFVLKLRYTNPVAHVHVSGNHVR